MKFRFVITSSINTPEREMKYVAQIQNTLKIAKSFPLEFYIVENNGKRSTAFDSIEGVNLCYTETNNIKSFTKIGMKEFHDLVLLGDMYGFEDDDIIIKLTGLYTLDDSSFIQTVMRLKDDYDAFVKFYDVIRNLYLYDDCCLGLYAMRYSYLKDFNYIEMSTHPSMEHIFAKYVREEVPANRTAELVHLGLLRENNTQLV